MSQSSAAAAGGRTYTASHSLAELSGLLAAGGDSSLMPFGVNVTCTEKGKIVLDHYRGMWSQIRLLPTKGQTHMAIMVSKTADLTSYHGADPDISDDWIYIKQKRLSSRPKDIQRIDKLMEANQLCVQAAKADPSNPTRKLLVERAVETSNLCSRAHFMRFELLLATVMADDDTPKEKRKQIVKPAQEAIAAGRAFKELIGTDDFCKGNLFSFVPTRWYMRSLYALGSFLFAEGELDGADQYMKEYLANDIHDKLGARHKQLLAYLEREKGIQGEEIPFLLKARFGDDQDSDDIFALWNYTRALHSFVKKGKTKASDKLLKYAITKNPYVPPVILAWELTKDDPILMQLGKEGEAGDYAADNLKHWFSVAGALEWLESVYCKAQKVSPPVSGEEARALLIEGTRLCEKGDDASSREGAAKFGLLEILGSDTSSQMARSIAFQRKAICHSKLTEYDIALRHYNSALCLCDPSDTESIKELFYNRASCKEYKGDLSGALEEYTFVYQRMGPFSTAIDGIKRVEAKLEIQTSVIPPCPDLGVDVDEDEVRKTIESISQLMPKINPQESVAANLVRCSHCDRGGVQLAKCSGCSDALFCSRECQVVSWKKTHKYVCQGSKHRLEKGMKVWFFGLEKAPQHNGKTGTVVGFLNDQGRFVVELAEGQSSVQMSAKPQNLKKVVGAYVMEDGFDSAMRL